MIKTLLKSVREYKRDSILALIFYFGSYYGSCNTASYGYAY